MPTNATHGEAGDMRVTVPHSQRHDVARANCTVMRRDVPAMRRAATVFPCCAQFGLQFVNAPRITKAQRSTALGKTEAVQRKLHSGELGVAPVKTGREK